MLNSELENSKIDLLSLKLVLPAVSAHQEAIRPLIPLQINDRPALPINQILKVIKKVQKHLAGEHSRTIPEVQPEN